MLCLPRKNHVRLIENCYPNQPGRKIPQPSETSYLVFYASSRPVKLAKVAQYLKKRVVRDAYKLRNIDILVTLGIINELMVGCSKDINLFAKCLLHSLSLVLEVKDFELSWEAVNTFRSFCSKYEGSSIGVDENLTEEFESLMNNFCTEASRDVNKESESKWRILGLRAIHGFVNSNIIKIANTKSYLKELIFSILSNINSFKDYLNENDELDTPRCLKEECTFDLSDTGRDELNVASLECGKQLLQNSVALHLCAITETSFRYIEEHSLYQRQDYCIDMVHFIMLNVSPSYRHIVVNAIRRMLMSCSETEVDQKKATLINVIAFCLNHRMAAVGLSVLEVVNALIGHLFNMLQHKNVLEKSPHGEEFTPLEAEFRKGIVQSIGGLATHLYYSEQINDILEFLINKLSLCCQEQVVDGVPVPSFRRALLKCMRILVDTNNEAVKKSHYGHSAIPFKILEPTLCLFTNKSPSVRKEYGFFFLSCLENSNIGESNNEASQKSSTSSSTKHVHRSTDSTLEFRCSLHKALFDYALQESLFPLDYSIILSILKKLLQRYQHDELIRALPMIFKLQEMADHLEHPHALDQLVTSYLGYAAEFLEILPLQQYMKEVIETRKQAKCWYDPQCCNIEELKNLEGRTFPIVMQDADISDQARRVNIEPGIVRDIVSNDELSQRHCSDLSKRLAFEYNREGNSCEYPYTSINPSQGVPSAKIQLTPSIPLIVRSEKGLEPSKTLKVEKLLEALKNGNDSSDFMDSDSSDIPREVVLTTKTKKIAKFKPDINALLGSVSANSFAISSNTLVNTPHLHH